MKRIAFNRSILAICLLFCAGSCLAQSALKLPPSKRITLANGLTVILVEQHETPIINFRCLVRAGSVLDPVGKEGLASLTVQMLRRGTVSRSNSRIDAAVDVVGGQLELEADHDYAEINAEFLTKDMKVAVDLLSDILQHPVFPLAELKKLARQEVDTIRQDKDQAEETIERFFDAYLFRQHPYGRPPGGTESSLATISVADVLRFYRVNYEPSSSILVVAGDFSSGEMEASLRDKFGSWKAAGGATSTKIEVPQFTPGQRLLLIDKPDSTQTFFAIGGRGVARSNPDRVGIELVNTIFGGRFTSMLNDALRVSSGLTYGARSEFSMKMAGGAFIILSYTKNSTTVQALDLALEMLRKLHSHGLTTEQLESARNYLKGQFPPQMETSQQLAEIIGDLAFYGLDDSEINEYLARLDKLTIDDVKRIIHTYYPLNDLVFVLIGKADEIRAQLPRYATRIDERSIVKPGFQ